MTTLANHLEDFSMVMDMTKLMIKEKRTKKENELYWPARYVYTYEEFVIVTEALHCNRMTATGQDTDNKIIIYQ